MIKISKKAKQKKLVKKVDVNKDTKSIKDFAELAEREFRHKR